MMYDGGAVGRAVMMGRGETIRPLMMYVFSIHLSIYHTATKQASLRLRSDHWLLALMRDKDHKSILGPLRARSRGCAAGVLLCVRLIPHFAFSLLRLLDSTIFCFFIRTSQLPHHILYVSCWLFSTPPRRPCSPPAFPTATTIIVAITT